MIGRHQHKRAAGSGVEFNHQSRAIGSGDQVAAGMTHHQCHDIVHGQVGEQVRLSIAVKTPHLAVRAGSEVNRTIFSCRNVPDVAYFGIGK